MYRLFRRATTAYNAHWTPLAGVDSHASDKSIKTLFRTPTRPVLGLAILNAFARAGYVSVAYQIAPSGWASQWDRGTLDSA